VDIHFGKLKLLANNCRQSRADKLELLELLLLASSRQNIDGRNQSPDHQVFLWTACCAADLMA
jgi:hypothetical protein